VRRSAGGKDGPPEADLAHQLSYAAPLFMASLLTVSARNLDKFIVASTLSTEEFALYSRGAIEIPMMLVVSHTVSVLLLPRFVKWHRSGEHHSIVRLWHRTLRRTLLLVAPIFSFFFITAGPLMTLLYSAQYLRSAEVFQVYLLISLVQITAYDAILQSFGKTREVFRGSLMNAVITLGLGILFMRIFGFRGPAWAFLVGMLTTTAYYLRHIKRVLDMTFRELMPWGVLLKTVAVAFVGAALATRAVGAWTGGQGAGYLMLSGVVFAPLFLGAAWFLKLLRPEDLTFLRRDEPPGAAGGPGDAGAGPVTPRSPERG
jgi:O-antigen/teichoic acid export membrane protein